MVLIFIFMLFPVQCSHSEQIPFCIFSAVWNSNLRVCLEKRGPIPAAERGGGMQRALFLSPQRHCCQSASSVSGTLTLPSLTHISEPLSAFTHEHVSRDSMILRTRCRTVNRDGSFLHRQRLYTSQTASGFSVSLLCAVPVPLGFT